VYSFLWIFVELFSVVYYISCIVNFCHSKYSLAHIRGPDSTNFRVHGSTLLEDPTEFYQVLSASKVTYIVSGGALNSNHSLTHQVWKVSNVILGWYSLLSAPINMGQF